MTLNEWLDKEFVSAKDRYNFKAWLMANNEAIDVLRSDSGWWQLWSRWIQATGGQ